MQSLAVLLIKLEFFISEVEKLQLSRGVSSANYLLTAARILSKMGQKDDAEEAWKALVESNPENYAWYKGYLLNQGIDLGEVQQVAEVKITYSSQQKIWMKRIHQKRLRYFPNSENNCQKQLHRSVSRLTYVPGKTSVLG